MDPDDAESAFDAACERTGGDPESIDWGTDPASLGPSDWTMTCLHHVAPLWPAARAALSKAESDRHIWPDPTIRSLAATIDQRRHVTSGPDLPAPRHAPLSATRVLARAASVTFLTLIGVPGLDRIACPSVCRDCFATLPEAVSHALPGTLTILALMAVALRIPAMVHLRHRS